MESLTKAQLKKRQKYFAHRSLSKATIKQKVIIAIVLILFSAYAISLIYPFFYLFVNSFKDVSELVPHHCVLDPETGIKVCEPINYIGFPAKWTFSSYREILTNGVDVGSTNNVSIFSLYFNSITLAVGETLVGMALCCMAAYVLAKYEFKGRKLIYTVVLISTFVPAIATLPAIYNLYTNPNYPIHLDGTYIGMIILNASAFGGSFLYVHSYFKVVPWSFAESAMMDGASDFRVFRQIMLPLAKNGIITFTILKFLGYWNDYWYPSLFYKNRPTLAVAIAELTNTSSPKIPLISAAMILAIVPVLIFYAITQKRLLSNAFDGGLK